MNKNKLAITPPMGWNSYDYYDTTMNEEQIKKNAQYMAMHLKEFGYEYLLRTLNGIPMMPEQNAKNFSTFRLEMT